MKLFLKTKTIKLKLKYFLLSNNKNKSLIKYLLI